MGGVTDGVYENYDAICAFKSDLVANQSRSWLKRDYLVLDTNKPLKGSQKEIPVLHYRALSLWEHVLDWLGCCLSTKPSRIASFCAEKKINDENLIQLYSQYIKGQVGPPQLLAEKEATHAVHLFYHFRPHQLDDECKKLFSTLVMKAGGVFAKSITQYRQLIDDEHRWPELMHMVEMADTSWKHKENEIQRIFHKMSDAQCVLFLKAKEKSFRDRVLPHLRIVEKNRLLELINKAIEFNDFETALALFRVLPTTAVRLEVISRLSKPDKFYSQILPLLTQEEREKLNTSSVSNQGQGAL